jgi:myo-inositol-1(or 4)-monophosphatase
MKHELEVLREAARNAGRRVLQLARDGFETHIKKDRSPVTSADLEVNRILHDTLTTAFPYDGWLSEETPDDAQRPAKKRVWIIDPIDGTKYFMRGIPQYAISAALVDDGQPVVAIVYNPATDELFSAARGSGAWLNGQRIAVSQGREGQRPVVLVNPAALERGKLTYFEASAELRPMGSIAYTLALVAAGRADATLNLDRLNEWDVVAGVLLVEQAGGHAVNAHGLPLLFNQPKTSFHGVIAGAAGPMAEIKTMVRAAT